PVVLAVDRVVRGRLELWDEVLPTRDQVDVHGLDDVTADEPQRRVAGGGNHVVLAAAALAHQRDHLVRGAGELAVHLAARLLLERLHPARVRIALPRDQVEDTLPLPDRARQVRLALRRLLAAAAAAGGGKGERAREDDDRVDGTLVHLRRRPNLLEPSLVEDGEPVAHRQRLFLVVRDIHEGDPDLTHGALDPLELDLHLLPQLQVERAERLVEEQHLRVVDQGARERDALALAARELNRLALAEARQLHDLEHLVDAETPIAPGHAL